MHTHTCTHVLLHTHVCTYTTPHTHHAHSRTCTHPVGSASLENSHRHPHPGKFRLRGVCGGPWGGGVAERPVRWQSDGLRQMVDPLLEVTCSRVWGPGAHAHSLSYCFHVLPSVRDADFPCRSPGACVCRPPTESDDTWFPLWSPQSAWTRKGGQLTHCVRQQSAFSQLTF